jgi:hypothetical protein
MHDRATDKGAIRKSPADALAPTQPRQDEVLSVAKVARLKGVTRAAVYAAIAQRRLSSVRVLDRIAIRAAAAEAWQPVRGKGRPAGIPMSADARRRISLNQQRRWQRRKQAK